MIQVRKPEIKGRSVLSHDGSHVTITRQLLPHSAAHAE